MEKKLIMLGIAIVFSFIFNAQAQRRPGAHYEKPSRTQVQDNYRQDSHQHYTYDQHGDVYRKAKRAHKARQRYDRPAPYRVNSCQRVVGPACGPRVCAPAPRRYWVEGYYSYHPYHGYVWHRGYYAKVDRGRAWVPTQYIKRRNRPGFRRVPGHYVYL